MKSSRQERIHAYRIHRPSCERHHWSVHVAQVCITCGVNGWPGAQVHIVDADRCGVRMSGDGALTPHRVTSGSVVSSNNGLRKTAALRSARYCR